MRENVHVRSWVPACVRICVCVCVYVWLRVFVYQFSLGRTLPYMTLHEVLRTIRRQDQSTGQYNKLGPVGLNQSRQINVPMAARIPHSHTRFYLRLQVNGSRQINVTIAAHIPYSHTHIAGIRYGADLQRRGGGRARSEPWTPVRRASLLLPRDLDLGYAANRVRGYAWVCACVSECGCVRVRVCCEFAF